ncbi:hypothetical protein MBLNU13_g02061t2 [Cladosporium sp. NU13]
MKLQLVSTALLALPTSSSALDPNTSLAKEPSSIVGYSSLNGPYYPASGGADGSLLLSNEEISRQINDPKRNFRGFLLDKYRKYQARNVSAADFVQAASNLGFKSCPGEPNVKTQEEGINPRELAALAGAHSFSRSFTRQEYGIPSGCRPTRLVRRAWDTKYFSQTQAKQAPCGVYGFDSDVNLANPNTACAKHLPNSLTTKNAMYKLSLLGLPEDKKPSLMDCTAILG